MALFAQYAMAASEEALQDSRWKPKTEYDFENTVSVVIRTHLCCVVLKCSRVYILDPA